MQLGFDELWRALKRSWALGATDRRARLDSSSLIFVEREDRDVLGFRLSRLLRCGAVRVLATAGLALGALALAAGPAAAHGGDDHSPQWGDWHHHSHRPSRSHTCTGTPEMPGSLAGFYRGDVTVEGVCVVNAGHAVVRGDLTVTPGSTLLAAFGLNDQTGSGSSTLTVVGDVRVKSGSTLLMGCEPEYFPCVDDPHPEPGTLSSRDHVFGNLIGQEALGIIVHDSVIGGNVKQTGGGGGVTCAPSGAFATIIKSPVFSDYEDNKVYGNINVTGLQSCWMGFGRDNVDGNLRVINDQLAEPNAIEIIANEIEGNLVCRENKMVWDSAQPGATLFPRLPEPNKVQGDRRGQCKLASPTTEGGPLGPGPF